MRNRELNHIGIANPDGICKRHHEPNIVSPKNVLHKAVREDSSRSFHETIRIREFYERAHSRKPRKQLKKRVQKSAVSKGASMAGHAMMMVTAVVFCSFVYVTSLTIHVRPCSSMAHSLAFQTSFRNPDSTPLRAELYAGEEKYSKDFVGVAYLLFDGLTEKTTYGLDIVNVETEEKIYQSTFLTAEKDKYQIRVEDPHMTEDGLFEFGLSVNGLEEGIFYTVYVMDENGKKMAVMDCSDTNTSFSIPIKSFVPQSGETGQSPGGTQPTPGQTGQSTQSPSGQTGQPPGRDAQPSDETRPPDEAPPEEDAQLPDEAPPEEDAQPPDEVSPEEDAQLNMDTLPFITVKINGNIFLPRVWGQEPEPIPADDGEGVPELLGTDSIEWVWNEEHTAVEALIPNPDNPEQPEVVRAEVTETVAKEPGCEEEGLAVYTASARGEGGNEYSDVQTAVIPPTGHNYERVKLDETQSGTSAEYVCPGCGKSYSIDVSATEEPD